MEWKFLLGLGAITLLAIGAVIYFGRKLNSAVMQRAPGAAIPLCVTPAGTVLWACVVSVWLICVIAATLRPGSPLGAFSSSVGGAGIVFAGSIVVAAIVAKILDMLGYPVAKTEPDS